MSNISNFVRTVALAVDKPLLFGLLWWLLQDWSTSYTGLTTKLARERLAQAFRVMAHLVWDNDSPKFEEPFSVCLAQQLYIFMYKKYYYLSLI